MIGLASADDLSRSNTQTAVVPVMYLKPNPGGCNCPSGRRCAFKSPACRSRFASCRAGVYFNCSGERSRTRPSARQRRMKDPPSRGGHPRALLGSLQPSKHHQKRPESPTTRPAGGPCVPGSSSLKHSSNSRPPGSVTWVSPATYRTRSSSEKTWNRPLSITVANRLSQSPSVIASFTWNSTVKPRSAAQLGALHGGHQHRPVQVPITSFAGSLRQKQAVVTRGAVQ